MRYGVGKSTLARWVCESDRQIRQTRRRPRAVDVVGEVVCSAVEADPFTTADDLVQAVRQTRGVDVSRSTIYRCLRAQGYTLKNAQRSSKHTQTDIRHTFFSRTASPYGLNAISVDESSFCVNDRPRRGWSRRGVRVPKGRPLRRKRVSLLLAIGREGVIAHKTVSGSVTGTTFAEFVSELPDKRPVIIDNASIHKTRAVLKLLNTKGNTVAFTPPYSPWFNPVEFALSWIKRRFRRLGRQILTSETESGLRSRVHDAVLAHRGTDPYFDHCAELWVDAVSEVRTSVCD